MRSVTDRFWEKVDRSGGQDACWPWVASRYRNGYGYFGLAKGHGRYAHRMSWALSFGPIPEGLHVLHRCDNPPCVNPAHLFLGTQKDNAQDAAQKGRIRGHFLPGDPRSVGAANPRSRLSEADVRAIRAAGKGGYGSLLATAERYGVSCNSILNILSGRMWKHLR